MRFILSTHKPINATYKDAETGVVQYKVRSPIKVHELISTISRRIDSDIPRRNSGSSQHGDSDGGAATVDSGRFGHLAQISWYMRAPSVMRIGGKDIDPATFFQKPKVPWYAFPERIFTAQDGKEYRWCGGAYHTKLKLNDGSDTVVAEYKCKSVGLITKKRDPYIEIFPPFEHMVDEIMITFIFVERLRKNRNDGTQQL
ncbi:hypothetical protein MVEN_00827500 [Mycena venus]|uniref:DUF6593 domain-containing protein n=1 Tax=Mycena venus TaxID=2733690 RepID=A0A8H6YH01_9AGAR|nr:hypothetical protein MVEN_00827500 [Mycena venus]